MEGRVAAKLTKWFFFSVLIALLPVAFNGLNQLSLGGRMTIESLLGRGELLLLGVAIGASAAGELLGSGEANPIPKYAVGGSSVIVVALSAYWYATVLSAQNMGLAIDVSTIAWGSVALFVMILVISLFSQAIAWEQ